MNLSNPFKVIVHYLLIGGMTCFSKRNRVSIMSALVCMITHSIKPMVSHDIGY